MKGNYNLVAPFYDRLSRIVYQNAIIESQSFLVDSIKANSTILIVGGGTGWLLEMISKKHPEGLNITYVDNSAGMIALAKKKNKRGNSVVFIEQPIQDAPLSDTFDVIITPFLLDNFSSETLKVVFNKLNGMLHERGYWLFADFQVHEKHHIWQKLLLKVMYFFFRMVCNIEAHQLPDTNILFKNYGYKLQSSKTFFHHFICSNIYIKQKKLW